MYDIIAIFTTNEFDNYCLSDKIIASIIIIILNIILIPINIIITILLILNRIFSYQNIKFIRNIIYANKIMKQYESLLTVIQNQNKIIEDKNLIINELEKLSYSPKLLEIRQNIINALKLQLEDKTKIIDETNKCSICFNNTISHCCVPCGHTYCNKCINKTNNCYICRGIIRNKIKLFF